MVLFYHSFIVSIKRGIGQFLKYCNFGHAYELYWHNPTIAVDYFFMLSGFGMMFSFLKHVGMSGTGGQMYD